MSIMERFRRRISSRERKLILKSFKIVAGKLEETWKSFGGENGDVVDTAQIHDLLYKESADFALRGNDFIEESDRIMYYFSGPNIPRQVMNTLVARELQIDEIMEQVRYRDAMLNLHTLEGRLEASMFFAQKKAEFEVVEDETKKEEAQRRAKACSAAIGVLLPKNSTPV